MPCAAAFHPRRTASYGRIWDEKKTRARSPRRPTRPLGGTQIKRRGFSSYGHRLGSLYRATDRKSVV